MSRLQISRLSKTYANGIRGLNDVSLDIPNGMFGLLGPNGAGKSTLMRILATLSKPDAGEVRFDGRDVHQMPNWLRGMLGYLPQDFGVYPGISAEKLLDHLAVLKGMLVKAERREQVSALLHQTNLYHRRNQAVSTFSDGMRQRFGIAQALLGNPQLVIADEPTAGLDPAERNRFHDLLCEIGEQMVVILSTHIVEDVHDLCPQMALLAAGRLVVQGKPALLTHSLDGRLWRKAVTRAELAELRTAWPVISTRMVGGTIYAQVLADERPASEFEAFAPGLEELYFATLHTVSESEVTPC